MCINKVYKCKKNGLENKESARLQVESVTAEEENTLVTRERNLPSYLCDYTDVPGQNKLLTIKIRRELI